MTSKESRPVWWGSDGKGSQDYLAGGLPNRNRKRTALKALMYDGQGFWLCHKRLSKGRFCWWPSVAQGGAQRLAAHQLLVLLSAGNPTQTGAAPDWRPVGPPS
jgi:transposase